MLERLFDQASTQGKLTKREVRHGAAFRLLSCSTHGEQEYFLDFRCIFAGRFLDDLELSVKGEHGKSAVFGQRSCVEVASLGKHEGDEKWYEMQCFVKLDAGFGTIYLDCRQVSTGRTLARFRAEESHWKTELAADFFSRARNAFADADYEQWLGKHAVKESQVLEQKAKQFAFEPLVSLVTPVYKTPPAFLKGMVDSILGQSYGNWELVVVNASPEDESVAEVLASYDDARIRIFEHPENDGINGNTNFGIGKACGDYIGFIDHDDFIEPDLLFEYVRAINEHDDVEMLYCDEDSFIEKEDGRTFLLPMFKPDMNIDLLYSNNYLVHLLMVSRSAIEGTTRAPDSTNGAQDYDLTLKVWERGGRVIHVPRVLYHWRIHDDSSNAGNDWAKPYVDLGCKAALGEHFERRGLDVCVQNTDVAYVYRCIPYVQTAPKVECILADDVKTRNLMAGSSEREYVLFGASDLYAPADEEQNLRILAAQLQREELGMIAPRLVTPDGISCCQWLTLRKNASVTFMGCGLPETDGGYNGRFHRPCNVTAVDGSCCMVSKEDFLNLGGYDTEFETLLYANIDLCLRYRQAGKLVSYTPFALYRHTQKLVDTFMPRSGQYQEGIEHDRLLLCNRWPGIIGKPDSLFNQNLDETNPYFVLAH